MRFQEMTIGQQSYADKEICDHVPNRVTSMNSIRRNFRQWWQPPRPTSERPVHRQVSFLELFYDLVYVVLIAELTHALAEHIDLAGIGQFAFLFGAVWWAWFNGITYHDLHGNDDIRTRVFTFLQMFTVTAMAVFAHNALGDGAVGFALAYAAFQLILTYLWWRTGVHDPNHRALSYPYSLVFLITTLIFVASVFVDVPVRFYLWAIALVASLLQPLLVFSMGRNNPRIQQQIDQSATASAAIVERFGLFTLIVLGEVIVGVVQGVAGQHDLSWQVGITAALGMVLAIGLWWLYFDFVSHRLPRPGTIMLSIWMYAHLPLTIGIATAGAAILNVVSHTGGLLSPDVRWLLVTAVMIALLGIAVLMQTLQTSSVQQPIYRRGGLIILVSAMLILALGVTDLQPIPLLIVMIVLLAVPVFYGFVAWVRLLEMPETAHD
jgi:low temperature requirement protein LtrA